MNKITALSSITIKAAPKDVFKYISQPKYFYLWNPSLRHITNDEPLKINSQFETETVILNNINIKSKNTVTEYEENKKLVLENSFGLIQYKQIYRLEQSRKIYTILRLKVDVITKSQILGLTNPVLKRLANNELKMDLNYLKVVVENKIDYTNILTAEF